MQRVNSEDVCYQVDHNACMNLAIYKNFCHPEENVEEIFNCLCSWSLTNRIINFISKFRGEDWARELSMNTEHDNEVDTNYNLHMIYSYQQWPLIWEQGAIHFQVIKSTTLQKPWYAVCIFGWNNYKGSNNCRTKSRFSWYSNSHSIIVRALIIIAIHK